MFNIFRQVHKKRPGLRTVSALSTTAIATFAATLSLSQPKAAQHPGAAMSTTASAERQTWPTLKYTSRHNTFPYTTEDLTPSDATPDSNFYSSPRFVTHIDDHAIAVLQKYFDAVLPPHSRSIPQSTSENNARKPRILDLCSSWVSHYPQRLLDAAEAGDVEVVGTGMNAAELERNPLFSVHKTGTGAAERRWWVQDLNSDPTIPPLSSAIAGAQQQSADTESASADVDASTMTVSIDYLTDPVAVLASLRRRTVPGGMVHLAISNRCFPTKAVSRWLRVDENERLQMVGDYLWFAGWRDIEIVELSDGKEAEDESAQQGRGRDMAAFMRLMGMKVGCDPLWVVRAKNTGEEQIGS